MKAGLQLVAIALLHLLSVADALKDGKYVLKVSGGACDGKIIAYPRYDKSYPGKVTLQSANATNPALWGIMNVGADVVTLQAVNRAKNYPGKLSYDKNCAKNPVFTAKSGAFKWDVVSSGSNFFLKPTHCADGFELGISCEGKEVVVFEAGQRARIFTPLRVTATVVSLNCPSGCNVCAPCDSTKGLCVNAPKGTSCSGGTCNGQGECVPAGSCTPACSECQNCSGNKCINSPVNTTCSTGLCDGQGSCKSAPPPAPQGCQSNSQCAAPTPICSSGKCVQCAVDYDCSSVILAPLCINNACSACPPGTYYESSACKPCSVCDGWFVFAGDCSALQDTQCTETIPDAPTIAVVPQQPLQLKVTWTAPPSATQIKSYSVVCSTVSYNPSATRSVTITGSPPATEVVIGTDAEGSTAPLAANEVYTCSIKATNLEDESQFSPPSATYRSTLATATYTPGTNPHIVKVKWTPSQDADIAQKFSKYLVECTSYDGPLNTVTAEISDVSTGQATVYPLSAACTYECVISTVTTDGVAAVVATNSFTTALFLSLNSVGFDRYNDQIYALRVAPDGKKLYACGYFRNMGGSGIINLAAFNFLTNSWEALGNTVITPTLDSGCRAMAFGSDGNLYACGYFDFQSTGNSCAKFNPKTNTWSAINTAPLGFFGYYDMAATSSGEIYIGGGNGAYNNVAKYNIETKTWSTLGSKGVNDYAYAVESDSDGKVYFGGSFTKANPGDAAEITANSFVQYNPSTNRFSNLGSTFNAYLASISADKNGNVYAVGGFTTPSNYAAVWDGSNWNSLGDGLPAYSLAAAAAPNGKFYACTEYDLYGWDPVERTWSEIGSGFNDECYKMTNYGVDLYVAGYFNTANGVSMNGFAKTATV